MISWSRFFDLAVAASLLLPGVASAQDAPAHGRPPAPAGEPTEGSDSPTDDPNALLPAPLSIQAVGLYKVSTGAKARLDMSDAINGSLSIGGKSFTITGDAKGNFAGTSTRDIVSVISGRRRPRSKVTLAVQTTPPNATNRVFVTGLTGTLDGEPITLTRDVGLPIPASELAQSDAGPTGEWKRFFDGVPDYAQVLKAAGVDPKGQMFWYNFGPVFYRGRLDGSARIMVIASDPGPEECLPFVRHPMVGDAGQRVQGFLARLGINRSYVLVNAYAYAMRPSFVKKNYGKAILTESFSRVVPPLDLTPAQLAEVHKITTWRNEFFTRVARSSHLEAIVPMGGNAGPAYTVWMASLAADDPIRRIPVVKVDHPSAVDRNPGGPRPDSSLAGWQKAVTKLRGLVKPDAGQSNAGPNYGEYFTENDYTRIPRADLPRNAPVTLGDNSDTRQGKGNNDAKRPSPDDFKTLVYTDPTTGRQIKYVYLNGVFHPELTTDAAGQPVKVDATGIPSD